jgi:hypothetical protein
VIFIARPVEERPVEEEANMLGQVMVSAAGMLVIFMLFNLVIRS